VTTFIVMDCSAMAAAMSTAAVVADGVASLVAAQAGETVKRAELSLF
jgi:hypothetical protein